ncbi:hypothetical protein [Methylobacterium pseudosasicola]|uniref:Uncharacterized protein n=1 Tax=Methylobacterium pseudosasicola TaxID=582667 RepID=A0A1I4RQ92_9HYPH|nr:hypothetical protein [Methylobacterium pseudosasicola]SFM54378.1 hypothetical protein SAMN05192568_103722 [Methylobacterium pseudosasicola]
MSNGLFQNLPGSHEMAGIQALPTEPWLLPISDGAAAAVTKTSEDLQAAVRQAARPFWLAANGLCIALGLALTIQCTTGWTPTPTRSAVTVAQATPPTIAPQTASLQR